MRILPSLSRRHPPQNSHTRSQSSLGKFPLSLPFLLFPPIFHVPTIPCALRHPSSPQFTPKSCLTCELHPYQSPFIVALSLSLPHPNPLTYLPMFSQFLHKRSHSSSPPIPPPTTIMIKILILTPLLPVPDNAENILLAHSERRLLLHPRSSSRARSVLHHTAVQHQHQRRRAGGLDLLNA
jgi:hypothetical protein